MSLVDMFTSQGWQCPICKRVYSPTTPMCYYCGNDKTVASTSTAPEATKSYHMMCNNCFYSWWSDTGFDKKCPRCGEKLGAYCDQITGRTSAEDLTGKGNEKNEN